MNTQCECGKDFAESEFDLDKLLNRYNASTVEVEFECAACKRPLRVTKNTTVGLTVENFDNSEFADDE